MAFYVTFGPPTTEPNERAAVAGLRGTIAACFLSAKGETGLDHCGARRRRGWPEARPVVVGSKLDLEGGLLGHVMLLALAEAKIATENRLRIGPTSILRAALLSKCST